MAAPAPSEREKMLSGEFCGALNATRERDTATRREESGRPVEIGSDVWMGGGAIVLPGVRIGPRTVIGAGSVVTRDVREGVPTVGNPCRVIREIPAS